jgi:hypothetical protein
VPEGALDYCIQQFEATPVSITVTRSRKSKWGDYRIHPNEPPAISVNGDLPPAFFLMTLLHELAHHHVHLRYGLRRVQPHGTEWKTAFATLMQPLLTDDRAFPAEMLPLLRRHMRSPKANATADQALYRLYLDMVNDSALLLEKLVTGTVFTFRQRRFMVKDRVRKRIVCECVATRRNYLFQPLTPVQI